METKDENPIEVIKKEEWHGKPLSVYVFGASGDLAKKKTFPSLLDLFVEGLLPEKLIIIGYARSKLSIKEFSDKIMPFLKKRCNNEDKIASFLSKCRYESGGYDDESTMRKISNLISKEQGSEENKLFYFALPPQVFIKTGKAVKSGMTNESSGFERVVIEKPFGHDTESASILSKELSKLFNEEQIYRIDHYLGKELVQNMTLLRFANTLTEAIWSRNYIKGVTITFKEDIDVAGRGGYFETSGIIRDVMQNHLLQVLSLVAMEPPAKIRGPGSAELIRDEKVKVLKCMKPWTMSQCVLGQYDGYPKDVESDKSNRETYACIVTHINNRRWFGVPFILKAGKALDERKAEVRIQLKNPPAYFQMFNEEMNLPRQEIVIRLQPDEAIYVKTNVKKPGLTYDLLQSELDLTYKERYSENSSPDAYTRLILDVLRGNQSTFVRNDELMEAWRIVTPLLNQIETKEGFAKEDISVLKYSKGSRGPKEADDLIQNAGINYSPDYASNWKNKK